MTDARDEPGRLLDGFVVRAMEPADAVALGELERQARAALVDARGGASLLAEQAAVGDWSSLDDDQHVWVAEIDGAAVGYLHLHHPQGSPTGHVRQVYLDPEAREVGFGDELLAAAIARLRERGATAVESWALPGDRDTKNLFERAGVTARKLVVSKRIV
ncbi:MAG: GNAT family N-acetyltransferase [Acidimicrobiales bacterium]|nr:GNAT family N-acetyltransferase [Acidimicrobiales bacterium]